MLREAKILINFLDPHEKRRAAYLLVMIIIMALLDTLGVASIMPFIAILADNKLIENNIILSTVYKSLGFSSHEDFFHFMGFFVFFALVLSLVFKSLTVYAQLRFTLMREFSLGKRLIEGYLRQPYDWFLNRHSAELARNILSEVGSVVSGAMMPMMTLIAQGVVAIFLLILLVFVDPVLAATVAFVLSASYILIYKIISGYLTRIGEARFNANQLTHKAVSEAFGAVKEVKLGGLEQIYIKAYAKPSLDYAKFQASAQVIAQLPRFALEAIAFGGMLLVMLYLMSQSRSFGLALPIITLYAFTGYRLMPALQQIYGSFSALRYAGPTLEALHNDLERLPPIKFRDSLPIHVKLKKEIRLKNVKFYYPNSSRPTLNGIDVVIPVHKTIAFVGATGSGKTTTIDLLLGLLLPNEGSFTVDGYPITSDNLREWQKNIGYVPQQIYLSDDTVASNIAFGLEKGAVDHASVIRAAKLASLHEFVTNDLPHGYDTKVGERGVRLSGGQRQRIGIARALYNNPSVLVLDEATSALDNLTERAVMDAVANLSHKVTIIIVAHRLSTVRNSDMIYMMDNGRIKACGTYDSLFKEDETFRLMAATK